jgi:ubiquinone/menaquinone biosynthesis C-methylase UbiE
VDLAFFCSVYRHIADRADYLRKLRACLKPAGRIAILEWRKTYPLHVFSSKGPPEEEKIDPEQVVRELQGAGFKILEQPEFLEDHFFVIAGLKN